MLSRFDGVSEAGASRRNPERRRRRFCDAAVEGPLPRILSGLVLFTLLTLSTLAAQTQPTPWNDLKYPPLPAFQPQQPTRIQLSNGMVIFLQPDHELPLISATARIRGGSVSEPVAKTGLVGLYGEVWRTGGTKDQNRRPDGRLPRRSRRQN